MKRFFLFLFMLFTISVVFSEDLSTDMKNKLTGEIKKNPGGWVVNMKYNDMKIEGDFYRPSPFELMIDTYVIDLKINGLKYKGNLLYKKPLFGENFYEFLNMKLNKKDLTGQIKKDFKKTYRKDVLEFSFEDEDIEGAIEYSRNKFAPIISLKQNKKIISGFQIMKDLYLKTYSLRFDDRKVLGTIKNELNLYKFNFQTAALSEDELFLFLFIEIYFMIEEDIELSKDKGAPLGSTSGS